SEGEERHSDTSFVDRCTGISAGLGRLAESVVNGLLEIDGSLDLVENSAGRWINGSVNFTTIKPQPRNKDLQFTLYGNPDKFDDPEFLKQDQNSYSRGWIRSQEDVPRFLTH